jgi:tetratricopeptide (TPR) repeat protein
MTPLMRAFWANPLVRRAAYVTGFALLSLTLLEFPRHAYNATHDLSSHATFEYYAAHHFQFGKQVYQNVGPYGYVNYAYNYAGYLPVEKIVLKNLSRLGLFLLILWASGRLPHPGLKLGWWAGFFVFQPFGWPLAWPQGSGPMVFQQMDWDQVYGYLTIYLAALYLLQPRKGWSYWLTSGALLVLLAFTALTKNTAFVLAGAVIVAVCLQKLLSKDFAAALGAVLIFALSLVVLWVLAGQEPINLPGFMRGIFAFSSGYNEALMKSAPPQTTLIGLLVVGLLCWRSVYNWLVLKQGIGRLMVEAALLFVAWKHGVVRGDLIHVSALFFAAGLLAVPFLWVTLPVQTEGQPARLPASFWLVVAAGLVLVPAALLSFPECRYEPRGLWERLRSNLAWVASPARQTAKMKGELRDVKALSALPGIKAKVRDSRVDYFGYEPGYVLLNDLNYWCRPMPITFAASNETLERANEAFYRNPQTAPEFVIGVVGSVDGRAAPQDDALALRALLDNYHPVLVEQRQVLLQKNPPPWLDHAEKTLLAERTVRWGERVSLAGWKDSLVWMEVDIQHSLAGKLVSFCFKPPPCYLDCRLLADESRYSRTRFVSSMGTSGCLISPFIDDNSELLKLYQPAHELSDGQRVESFGLSCDPADHRFFKDEIRIRLYSVARPTKRSAVEQSRFAQAATRLEEALQLQPESVDALNDLAWLCATCPEPNLRDAAKALRLAKHAADLTGWKDPGVLETLAAAYAEGGHFAEAIKTVDEATKLCNPASQQELLETLRNCQQLFESRKPVRQ